MQIGKLRPTVFILGTGLISLAGFMIFTGRTEHLPVLITGIIGIAGSIIRLEESS